MCLSIGVHGVVPFSIEVVRNSNLLLQSGDFLHLRHSQADNSVLQLLEAQNLGAFFRLWNFSPHISPRKCLSVTIIISSISVFALVGMTLQNLVPFKCTGMTEKIGWIFSGRNYRYGILADQVCSIPFDSTLKPGSSESKSSDKLHILTAVPSVPVHVPVHSEIGNTTMSNTGITPFITSALWSLALSPHNQ